MIEECIVHGDIQNENWKSWKCCNGNVDVLSEGKVVLSSKWN